MYYTLTAEIINAGDFVNILHPLIPNISHFTMIFYGTTQVGAEVDHL